MNPSTKRATFQSFYEESVFIVTNLPNNNIVELINPGSSEKKTVYKKVIKKINLENKIFFLFPPKKYLKKKNRSTLQF